MSESEGAVFGYRWGGEGKPDAGCDWAVLFDGGCLLDLLVKGCAEFGMSDVHVGAGVSW